MRRGVRLAVVGLVVGVLGAPTQVRAAEFIQPWTGIVFGNDQAASGFHSIGFSFGDAGHGLIGTETSVGLAPGFFGDRVENYVLDLMAGFIIGPTLQSKAKDEYRPFAIVEFGTIRTSIDGIGTGAKLARNDIGIALGGGCTFALNDRLNLRGDVRYIKAINSKDVANSLSADLQDFHFWRTSIGLVIH